MTAWKTCFTLGELLKIKALLVDSPDLCRRVGQMVECLGACISNEILVSVVRDGFAGSVDCSKRRGSFEEF